MVASTFLIPARIEALRQQLHANQLHACLIPSADPHASEYLPERWQGRQWLTGFSGSSGQLLVTLNEAALWTDSRYYTQAEAELAGSGISLMRQGEPETPEPHTWLLAKLTQGQRLAIAGDSISLAQQARLSQRLAPGGIVLCCDLELLDAIWTDRPPLPARSIYAHPAAYLDSTRQQRLERVRAAIRAQQASYHLLSSLDDIAWLFQLRGSDVECNPVFLAYALLDAAGFTQLFLDRQALAPGLAEQLEADEIRLRPYAELFEALAQLDAQTRLLLDPERVAYALAQALPATVQLIFAANPSTAFKAIKSPAELGHIRSVMRHDGAALMQGMYRLKQALAQGETLSELDVADILQEARQAQRDFVGLSFPTIAGYAKHAALPHYRATATAHAQLRREGILLIDSGGQYLGGTTDITRVWALGPVAPIQREHASRVLQGMIALSQARFPRGAHGPQLDALARAPLWAAGLDYGHGTGHGVGYFLNVHEGPHSIRPPREGAAMVPLEVGMISSIEPGFYKPEHYGIRHENLVAVQPANQGESGEFLGFETLTLCPFDPATLDFSLFAPAERAWLATYHRRVEAELAPLLAAEVRTWLSELCQPFIALAP